MAPEEAHPVTSVNLLEWLTGKEIQGFIITKKKALAVSFCDVLKTSKISSSRTRILKSLVEIQS